MEIMRIKTFFHLYFLKKTGHSIAQNRQRDDILKHFIGLTSDSRLKKRIQDRSKQPRQDFCCTVIDFSSAPVLRITDLQHNSSWLRQNAHHIACRVIIRYLNKIIVPDVIVYTFLINFVGLVSVSRFTVDNYH